jgi:hypothetical protein
MTEAERLAVIRDVRLGLRRILVSMTPWGAKAGERRCQDHTHYIRDPNRRAIENVYLKSLFLR